ncbi:permease component [Pseudomonas syringae pv. actinidiae]|uniref:Permease component n=1 Tax=Pseudomonas syringae pv. actinidiae TaxID=103796 RepID=A0A2V0Q7W3_PSESF|nr:permease component [Pseudomonas syringae pv. actinidiae]
MRLFAGIFQPGLRAQGFPGLGAPGARSHVIFAGVGIVPGHALALFIIACHLDVGVDVGGGRVAPHGFGQLLGLFPVDVAITPLIDRHGPGKGVRYQFGNNLLGR